MATSVPSSRMFLKRLFFSQQEGKVSYQYGKEKVEVEQMDYKDGLR